MYSTSLPFASQAMLKANYNACGVRLNMLCPTYVKTGAAADLEPDVETSACPQVLRDIFNHYGGWLRLAFIAKQLYVP